MTHQLAVEGDANSYHHLKLQPTFLEKEAGFSESIGNFRLRCCLQKYDPKSVRSEKSKHQPVFQSLLRLPMCFLPIMTIYSVPSGHIVELPSHLPWKLPGVSRGTELPTGTLSYGHQPSAFVGSKTDCHPSDWLLKLRIEVMPKKLLCRYEDPYTNCKMLRWMPKPQVCNLI